MKYGFHIHSKYSHDCSKDIESILKYAEENKFDALAITDHNTTAGSIHASKLSKKIQIIIGAEFSTDMGHILALNIDKDIEKNCEFKEGKYKFEDIVREVKKQGGLLIAAHPYNSKFTKHPEAIGQLHGFELINGRMISDPFNKKSSQFIEKLKKMYPEKIWLGSSDAHTLDEINNVFVLSKENNINDVLFSNYDIKYKKTDYKTIYKNKINSSNNFKSNFKQRLKYAFSLLNGIKGDKSHETIRICKKNKS